MELAYLVQIFELHKVGRRGTQWTHPSSEDEMKYVTQASCRLGCGDAELPLPLTNDEVN